MLSSIQISRYFIFFLFVISCVEPYDFVVEDTTPSLVVQSFVSDKSFNETLSYPSDGRYFSVKLSWTSIVDNLPSSPVTQALVQLLSNNDEVWTYETDDQQPGIYYLRNETFKAQPGTLYRLTIQVGEDRYESAWESLPEVEPAPIGNVEFAESTKQTYVMRSGLPNLETVKIVTAKLEVPVNISQEQIFYHWRFDPMWIYRAPLSSVVDPGHVCWVTDTNFIPYYALQTDRSGGYEKELFSMETVRNIKIYEDLSVLITQHAISADYYLFLKEMMDQNEGGIIDVPPFNLKTNIHGVGHSKRVSGYFGVVKEQARRWYFNRNDLSYFVKNTLKSDCTLPFLDPGPECFDCREYPFGTPVPNKPSWWRKE